jgi:hypothetical protein
MDPGSQPNAEMSELERRLLEAARHDHVPDALSARMADGLAAKLASATLSGGPAVGAQLGSPLLAKMSLWGVLSLAVVGAVAGWYATRPAPAKQRAEPAVAISSPAAVAAAEPAAQTTSQSAQSAADMLASAAGGDDEALRAEIALLDRAHKALRGGASALALRLLDEHRERFARARLAPEASALRIEALVQRGSREQARSLSRQFVSAYPTHPLTEHVAKLAAP